MKNTPKVIAEVGVNHNGSLKLAKKYIDYAHKNKIDFVKFQIYKTDNLVLKNSKTAPYQKKNTKVNSQYKLLKKLEFSFKKHFELFKYCKNKKTKYLASPFDIESAKFLVEKINCKIVKIPSGEITNNILLSYLSKKKLEIILSTGASNLKEISKAIKVLLSNKLIKPRNITLMQCTTDYPAQFDEINLNVLSTFKKKFNLNIGISDHSQGLLVPIASMIYNPKYLEKHITINKKLSGPDHKSSLDFKEFSELIISLKNYKKIFGSYIKKCSVNEKKNKRFIRKSLYASKKIFKGDKISIKNIFYMRPFNMNSVQNYKKLIGSKAKRNFEKFDLIKG